MTTYQISVTYKGVQSHFYLSARRDQIEPYIKDGESDEYPRLKRLLVHQGKMRKKAIITRVGAFLSENTPAVQGVKIDLKSQPVSQSEERAPVVQSEVSTPVATREINVKPVSQSSCRVFLGKATYCGVVALQIITAIGLYAADYYMNRGDLSSRLFEQLGFNDEMR